jgi:mannose-6-phosphate isomerase-like protein (cupin superfamily)
MRRRVLRFASKFRVALSNRKAQVAEMTLPAGHTEGDSTNRHRGADQWLYVVEGTGAARVEGKRYRLSPGTLLLIECGDRHEIRNTGRARLKTLNFYAPPAYTDRGEQRPRGRKR